MLDPKEKVIYFFNNVKELKDKISELGLNVDRKRLVDYENGLREETRRHEKKKVWVRKEIEDDWNFGLSINRKSHRICACKEGFLIIMHSGKTLSNREFKTKENSMYVGMTAT